MAHIDYYLSTLSPFAYLAGTRLEEIAARHGATITYKPLDIIALFARTGGTPPAERHPSRQAWRAQDLPRQARKLGMPLNPQPAHWPTNPAPSSYAIIAAQGAGGGDVGGAGSFGPARLLGRGVRHRRGQRRACLPCRGRLRSGAGRQRVAERCRDLRREPRGGGGCRRLGSPFYVTDGGQVFWGQDRLEDLDMQLSGKL